MTAAGAAAGAALEGATAAFVHWLKKSCQWIITRGDLVPDVDRDGLERFLVHGWDSELGWVRKPNTGHDETAKDGRTCRYHIDATGARLNPGFDGQPTAALAYGDSYAFCRQVNDDETWPHFLSRLTSSHVANRGVGNYGLDQALLRLEREFDAHPAPVVLMGVVPETICRVAGLWRHFSEYGNVFAFKPRFVLNRDGGLDLVPNPTDSPEKFLRIADMLPHLIANDIFYSRKFAPDMLRFPYLFHLARSWRRNLPLAAAALADRWDGGGRRAFCQVMDRNIELTAALYQEPETLNLMTAIAERFSGFVRGKGAMPVLVFLPQLYDLKRLRAGNHYYAPFLRRISETVTTLDLGPVFAAERNDAANYIDDRYGGHFSVRGNRIVAERLRTILVSALAGRRPAQAQTSTGSE